MLYYLFSKFNLLDNSFFRLFQYTSFRAGMTLLLSMFISLVYGKRIINFLTKNQMNENIRFLGLKGENDKKGTPSMGGVIIIISTIIPVLIFSILNNVYIIILIFSLLWLGIIGFIDDYIKIFKNNKKGLNGRFKILGQIILGIFVSFYLCLSKEVTIKKKINNNFYNIVNLKNISEIKTLDTTLPFIKNNQFNYSDILNYFFRGNVNYILIYCFFSLCIVFIICSVSNGANLTDGIDGLAAGISAVIMIVLSILVFVSGNVMLSNYLNIMYIPRSQEVLIFCGALTGSLIGFIWYNSYPAQIFMGDTGSLTIGGVIGVIAIIVRKELLLPLICGIFFTESLSVIIQVIYFKITKKIYGKGSRIFLMSPLHHHYQKLGYHENKIVVRFIIINIILAVLSIITLKLR